MSRQSSKSETKQDEFDAALVRDESGLALCGGGMCLQLDFSKSLGRLQRNKLSQELLVKAAKIKGFEGVPLAVDATAGLGEDALLLAAAGFEVILFERDPVIAALLEDGMSRALEDSRLKSIVSRMYLRQQDSVEALPLLDRRPQVVLLDPMFPQRTKSASVGKKFQLLHCLEQPCVDEKELLVAARAARPRKIVIKRPLKGAFLAGEKPDYSLKGKAIRYDVFSFSGE